ncbi:spore protease YyaC [Chengkuizengella axinellae]|uniref:Spore protease YyaC n=1 Tax=Chengkuizengella axinellae TaxID=3064388 RepID=A0ABT9J373_9BACL|nr:spore protease YyaC [Chengkuizengella sp. 2205SS18-9]MDP5276069.1 spore protease YyaC [Chengkuizengella sp. 2205SS18-9]
MRLGSKHTKVDTKYYKIAHNDPNHTKYLTNGLYQMLSNVSNRKIIVLCIGSDRSTGDSLGPLVGYHLSQFKNSSFKIFGTLDEPVHAVNLNDKITEIKNQYHNPFIIAVDACLGKVTSVGHIQIGDGPLKPGAGVNKNLPAVGDIHVTGIVNVSGFMEYFVLQNTRLNLVVNMSKIIADSIQLSTRYFGHQSVNHTV